MENLDGFDFDFNDVYASGFPDYGLENLRGPAFLQPGTSANLEAPFQNNVGVVEASENSQNDNQGHNVECVNPYLPHQSHQASSTAGVGYDPTCQLVNYPLVVVPSVTASAFVNPAQLTTNASPWGTGGGQPALHEDPVAPLPNVPPDHFKPRPSSIVPANSIKMYRDTRGNRDKQMNSAIEVYPKPPPRPQPWGRVDDKGRHQFRYTLQGELEPSIVMSHREMSEYLYAKPLYSSSGPHPQWEERQVVEGMRCGLTLWIGWNPPHSKGRHPNADTARCRFQSCPINKRTINTGEPRVIFDERCNEKGTKCDPYHNAGYCHLFCLEMFLDILKLYNELDVRLDTRHLVFEEQNWAGLHNRHHEQPHIAQSWFDLEMPKYHAHCVALERRLLTNGRISKAQAQRPRHFDDSLTKTLVIHSISKETNGVRKGRINRRREAVSANRPLPCDIEIHLGNLIFMQQCIDEKKVNAGPSRSRAEREKRVHRTSWNTDTMHFPDSYQPAMFTEYFTPGRGKMTPSPPPQRGGQPPAWKDSYSTVGQATYEVASGHMLVNNPIPSQQARLPRQQPGEKPYYADTNRGIQIVEANSNLYVQQYVPHPQDYAYQPQQSLMNVDPQPVSVVRIPDLSSSLRKRRYDETEHVDNNAGHPTAKTDAPSPKRVRSVEAEQDGKARENSSPRRTPTPKSWQRKLSFDLNEWVETVTTVHPDGNRRWAEDAFHYIAKSAAGSNQCTDSVNNSMPPVAAASPGSEIIHQDGLTDPNISTTEVGQLAGSFIHETPPIPASPASMASQQPEHVGSPVAGTEDEPDSLFDDVDPTDEISVAQDAPGKTRAGLVVPEQVDNAQGTFKPQEKPEGDTYMPMEIVRPKDGFRVRKRKASPGARSHATIP